MKKIQYLRKYFSLKGKKKNQLLFVKFNKNGLLINIFIEDPDFENEADEKYIDASHIVFQTRIDVDSHRNNRVLKVLQGISGVAMHLQKQVNWRFDTEKGQFCILHKGNQVGIYESSESKLSMSSVQAAIQIIKHSESQLEDCQLKYLLSLSLRSQKKQYLVSKTELEQRRKIIKRQAEEQQIEKMKKAEMQARMKLKWDIENQQKNKEKIMKENELKEQQKKSEPSVQDSKRAKQKILNYISSTSFGIEAFRFEGMRIIKNGAIQHQMKERNIFGSTNMPDTSQFTVLIERIAKENRNPVIWIGIADAREQQQQKKEVMQHVICMSDRRKIYQNGRYNFKDSFGNTLSKDFVEGDIVVVKINFNKDSNKPAIITWENEKGETYGSSTFQVKDKSIKWVPFIELWKNNDTILWLQ